LAVTRAYDQSLCAVRRRRAFGEAEVGSRNAKIIAAVAVVAAVALAVVLTISLTSNSKPAPLSTAAYLQLYAAATVGKTQLSTVLDTWPKETYQDFHDGSGNRCLEWFDRTKTRRILYDLCFDKTGALISKQTP
jgi:hypothetical protein